MAEGDNVFSGPLSNPTLRTIFVWGVAVNILGRALDPLLTQLGQVANAAHPEHAIDPALAADMVLRGWLDQATGESEAAAYGVNAERFAKMVHNTGEPPGLTEVLELFRRGFIPWDGPEGEPSVTYAIKTSRVQNLWSDALRNLQFGVPSPGDVIDALVENQTDRATAAELLAKSGMNPDYLDLLFHTRGRPPGPEQLAHMVHRGLIPPTGTGPQTTSFEQGIAESAVKDKWTDLLLGISEYLPPPRTVTAMLREGAYTAEEAADLFRKNGLSERDVAAYVAAATHQKVAAEKNLAKSEVTRLYEDQVIPRDEAVGMLASLGYHATEADFLLEIADLTRERKYVEAAIGKVRSLYVARHLDRSHAVTALDALAVNPAQRDALMHTWDLERTSTTRILSEAQVVNAWEYKVITQAEAQGMLEQLGYSAFDAWVLLSEKNKAPLPNPPPRVASPSGNIT